MPPPNRDLISRLSIEDDPLMKFIGGLFKPVLAIGGAAAAGPVGAVGATILSEAISQIEGSVRAKEDERVAELLLELNNGLLRQEISPEDIVEKIEALSSQKKSALFSIIERAYESIKSERVQAKRKIVRQFLQDTLSNVDRINLEEREFFETILLDLNLVDFQVLSRIKNGPPKVHPEAISIPGVAPFYVISSIINLENFALIKTVKQGMQIGGDLVDPSRSWWVGISDDGRKFYEYCLTSSESVVNPV